MPSLSQDFKKSEGWKRFPIVDIVAAFVIAAVAVAFERVYGGNAPFAIALLIGVGGLALAMPLDYAGWKRWRRKPRDEAVKDVIYGIRIFIIIAVFSIVSSLLLNYI